MSMRLQDIKQRISNTLNTIDSIIAGNSSNEQGAAPQTSSGNTTSTEVRSVQPNNTFQLELVSLKNELISMKKNMMTLTVEVSSSQQAIKSLTGLGKQVASLQATVNKLLSQSIASQNPCDTPEGLSGEIPGCP